MKIIRKKEYPNVLAINVRFLDQDFFDFIIGKGLEQGLKGSTYVRNFLAKHLETEYKFYLKQKKLEAQQDDEI
ncbi:hypothetical protein HN865_01565 [Candidatus Woesearchaeota archaeon]|jgi:hypothetical protein|nr:hypothetical protein [Candidatus Woesearchaeota archaeon]MBT7237525.1 hypothetical protein [Candidatus Woesearchaeota archaeon]